MKVECEVEETELEGDIGRVIEGVRATCERCGHETESFGTGENSVKRCLVLMREQCPNNETNFYVGELE